MTVEENSFASHSESSSGAFPLHLWRKKISLFAALLSILACILFQASVNNHLVNVDAIMDLVASEYTNYVGANCVLNISKFDRARHVIRSQLYHVPQGVRDRVVGQVLIPQITHEGNARGTVDYFAEKGVANIYTTVWSTNYTAFVLTEGYSTCYMVSGIEFKATKAATKAKRLTLKHQELLHEWMLQQAVSAAKTSHLGRRCLEAIGIGSFPDFDEL